MKKKILLFAAIAAITVTGLITPVKATKDINPECPNGCVQGCDGCYCYGWYHYNEAEW